MKSIYPDVIKKLPQADLHFPGAQAFLSQGEGQQILFMEFSEDVDLPEHFHAGQVGFVLEGSIDLTIGGEKHTYQKGDRYYIPEGMLHSGKIYAGYADITYFDQKDRYEVN